MSISDYCTKNRFFTFFVCVISMVFLLESCCNGCPKKEAWPANKKYFENNITRSYINLANGNSILVHSEDYECEYGPYHHDGDDCLCTTYELCGQSFRKVQGEEYILDHTITSEAPSEELTVYFKSNKFVVPIIERGFDTLATSNFIYYNGYFVTPEIASSNQEVSKIYYHKKYGVVQILLTDGTPWNLVP